MRRHHFEALQPLCPVCRGRERDSALALATVVSERDDDVLEGVLRCTDGACLSEYPILDGIPLLVANLREFVAANVSQLTARDDLSPLTESLLGDCCGPGSAFDATRQHLSSYAWDHYGDLDPDEDGDEPQPGSVVALLERALESAGELPSGPLLDVGCAVGRTTFELARGRDELVLGVDLNVPMLRTARRALASGVVSYPRRRVGLVYDRRSFEAELPSPENVDFWACDAAAPPFAKASFAAAAALNVIDCLPSPAEALGGLGAILVDGGKALLTSPYDWSPAATPVEAWLGGHSQRGEDGGASEPMLRRLLTPGAHPASIDGLRVVDEAPSLPWRVRMHERSTVEYRVHLLVAEKSTHGA